MSLSASAVLSSGRSFVKCFCRNLLLRQSLVSRASAACRPYSQEAQKEDTEKEASIKLSDRCVQKLQSFGDDDRSVRVVVEGGGCSGFQYKFDLDNTIGPEDRVFEREGVKVIVDIDSLEYLKGSTIDYEEELIRSSFKVVENPLAEHGCSCGASFSLKL